MSAARIRSALAPALSTLGFVRRGSDFALKQTELEHVVSVFAVRRLTGFFDVIHSVFERDGSLTLGPNHQPLVRDRIGGFSKLYLNSWELSRFDPALALRQVSAIVGAFGSLADVEHFLSDRRDSDGAASPQTYASQSATSSLSQEQEERALRHHSNAILRDHFVPAPRLGDDMWAHRLEVGGYRYCAYLKSNETATLATIMYFAFASRDIEKGRKTTEVIRLLYGTPKHLLSDSGQPILIPLASGAVDHASVTEVLLKALAVTPPNSLPRDGV